MVKTSNRNGFGFREYAINTKQLYILVLTKKNSILGKTPAQKIRYMTIRAMEIPESQIVKGTVQWVMLKYRVKG